VDFELTDEQEELRRVARDLVDRDCPPSLVRAVIEGDEARADEFWKTLVQAEWPGLTVPIEYGGTGATPVELSLVLEELGRGADPTPFLATTSQYVALLVECPVDDAAELLAAVNDGGTGTAAFAPESIRATRDGDAWRLTGRAHTVLDGDRVDEIAVAAATEDGHGVFVVPAAATSATRTPSFDGTLHVADVVFDDVEVLATRAATDDRVALGAQRARQHAVVGVAATTVGACQRVFEMTLDHVRNRKQFDVPIGSFQAVKHMTVDMYVAIERARALHQFAALTIAADDDRRDVAASMAKAAAGDAQRLVAGTGVQLFGGLGFTWENDLQIFVRRAKAGEHLLGSSAQHRNHVARSLLARGET
jgi:alkylation response protein AidB-like acyl-CoA dehydrogenase